MRFVSPLLIGLAGCVRVNFDPIGAAVDVFNSNRVGGGAQFDLYEATR